MLLYPGEDIDNESEKKRKNKEDKSCARLILEWDTSVLANENTHVGPFITSRRYRTTIRKE